MRRRAPVFIALLILFGCGGSSVNRAEWQQMSREDRVLYVKSLIGAERVKDAKGGNGRAITRTVEDSVTLIDEAYGRGDAREAHQIFTELPPAIESTP